MKNISMVLLINLERIVKIGKDVELGIFENMKMLTFRHLGEVKRHLLQCLHFNNLEQTKIGTQQNRPLLWR